MKRIIPIALFLTTVSAAWADVTLSAIIDSKMVLQRDVATPVWGWADEGEAVTVTFAGQTKTAIAGGAKGKWMVKLDPMKASATPRVMTIKGKREIELTDVLVGEVWLATGQSNMEFNLSKLHENERQVVYEQATNNLFRMFCIPGYHRSSTPLDNPVGSWSTTPEFAADLKAGKIPHYYSHSAIGCFFGLELQRELDVPVAVIDSSWGGQKIENFISPECYKEAGFTDRRLGVYNGMIAPLAPYALKGVLWYQGEASRGSSDYAAKLKALSTSFSRTFNVKDIPLYQVQIAPGAGYKTNGPTLLCDTIWAAQYQGAAEVPGMEIVAIHDAQHSTVGLHPAYKKTVGDRLAAMALNKAYGKDVSCTGPRFASATRKAASIVVRFKDIDQGLESDDGKPLGWFELSVDGKTFVSATAVIEGETVVVTATDLAAPRFVRMGWNERALPNLRDKNGWPVFAFSAQEAAARGQNHSD